MQIKLLEDKIYKAYQNYEFHIIYHAVQNFSIVDMSSFYLNILKDRLYVLKNDSLGRRSAQTVIYHLLNSLIRLIAPIYSFTADEVWEHMPHYEQKEESVHLTEFLHTNVSFIDQDFIRRWELFLEIREIVLKELETKREQNIIHDSLEARLNLFVPSNKYDIVNKYKDLLKEIFIVSQLQIEKTDGQMKAMVEKARGNKCLRCWNYDDSVGTLSENKDV